MGFYCFISPGIGWMLTKLACRPNYSDARPLLVIFHDPPEVKGVPDPRTNRLELHNTWLVSWLTHFPISRDNIYAFDFS